MQRRICGYKDITRKVQICSSNINLKDSLKSGWNVVENKAKKQVSIAKTRVKNVTKKGAKKIVKVVVKETIRELNPLKRNRGEA